MSDEMEKRGVVDSEAEKTAAAKAKKDVTHTKDSTQKADNFPNDARFPQGRPLKGA
jgi:hypothetical protein